MDKRLLFMGLVGYSLMIITYTLDLIGKYNALIGLLILISTIVIILLILKYFLENKEINDSPVESDSSKEVGTKLKVKKEVLIEDVEQPGNARQKKIGTDVEAEKIKIRKIRQ